MVGTWGVFNLFAIMCFWEWLKESMKSEICGFQSIIVHVHASVFLKVDNYDLASGFKINHFFILMT